MATKQNDYSSEALLLVGKAVSQLGAAMQGYRDLQVVPTGMSIRGPKVPGGEFLVTLKAVDAEGASWVAFNSAFTLDDCFRGLDARLSNGTLKWRPDQFA